MATGSAGARSEQIRQRNLGIVLRHLHCSGPVTRSDLGATTGLTRSAVKTIVGDLARLGLVTENSSVSSGSPGRPSTLVAPNALHVTLAMEILVDTVAIAVVSLGGTIRSVVRVERRADASPVDTVDQLAQLLGSALDDCGDAAVHGITVAVPGSVRRSDNAVVLAPNLGWREVPLGEILRAHLNTPVPVTVVNDGDAGALGETRRGAAKGVNDVVYVYAEVGVGGGVVVDGQPLRGARGFAAEVGHIPVRTGGRTCKCGSTGCWETEAGEVALLKRAGRRNTRRRAGLDAVMSAAAEGDQRTLDALDEHGIWIGVGVAALINIFDPQRVVLGGALVPIYAHIERAMQRELERRVFDSSGNWAEVVPAKLGAEAPLVGAAEWSWDALLTNPAESSPVAANSMVA
ncbi:MAG: ROK family transcriptional regulator [Ilumatobacteraceae bacterium]|nr:ROK family transcriptional regulator [Ilumatobacteraceae bacterium]